MNFTFNITSNYGIGNLQALSTVKSFYDEGLERFDEYTFNFSQFRETNPFNILLIANAINNFHARQKVGKKYNLTSKNDDGYLAHIGFFDLFNINYGKRIGEANSNSNYVPIRKIVFEKDFYETIDEKAQELSRLYDFDLDLRKLLEYALVETIRNAYEHSCAKEVLVCAQKWRTRDEIEIAIVDSGCGIASAMARRYKNRTEEELFNMALLPGVSAQSNHLFLGKYDFWRNSGYGLYVLNELAPLYGGSFLLCSGGIAKYRTPTTTKYFTTMYQGTAIAFRIKTNTDNDFKKIRSQIIERGEKQARNIDGSIKRASKSSGGFYG